MVGVLKNHLYIRLYTLLFLVSRSVRIVCGTTGITTSASIEAITITRLKLTTLRIIRIFETLGWKGRLGSTGDSCTILDVRQVRIVVGCVPRANNMGVTVPDSVWIVEVTVFSHVELFLLHSLAKVAIKFFRTFLYSIFKLAQNP